MRMLRQLTAVTLLAVLVGCGSATTGGDTADQSTGATDGELVPQPRVSFTYDGTYGLNLDALFIPDHPGRVIEGTFAAAGRTTTAYPFRPGFDTDNWPPKRHPTLTPGRRLYLNGGSVLPRCDGKQHDPPVVTMTSRTPDGRVVEDKFAVVRRGETAAQTQQWVSDVTDRYCSQLPVADLAQASSSADNQTATVTYDIRNPGPDEVTVTSRAWASDEGARWLPASVTVPADGEPHRFTIRGVGGICAGDDPLVLGLLSASGADGERHRLTGYSDGLANVCE